MMRNTIHGALAALALAACAQGIDPPEATAVRPVQGGSFTLGSGTYDPCTNSRVDDNRTILECSGDTQSEMIRATAEVANFCIDEHEVTVDQYRHCVARGECSKPASTNAGNRGTGFIEKYYGDPDKYGNYPVLGVTWEHAREYCAFRDGRLPTEVEWEFAATSRGSRPLVFEDDVALNDISADCNENENKLAFGPCSGSSVREVKTSSIDQTAQGIFDMAANAQEWTEDEYDYLAYCDSNQPGGVALTDLYVITGTRAEPKEDSAWPATLLTVDVDACLSATGDDANRYSGQCNDQAHACLAVCVEGWSGGGQTASKQSNWQTFDCEARFRADGCGECGADAPAECAEQCACKADPRDAAADDGECLRNCFAEYSTCAATCAAPDVSFACLRDGTDPRPRPVCKPRAYSAQESATGHTTPEAFVSSEIEGRHVARGAHFQETDSCELRPTRREPKNVSSPLVGFRCAYNAGQGPCR